MTRSKNSHIPFLKIIVPAAAGIVAAWFITVPLIVSLICLVVVLLSAILTRRTYVGGLYVWFAIALFFFVISDIRRPRSELPIGERAVLIVQIEEKPSVKGRWQTAIAHVGFYRFANEEQKDWVKVNEKIKLSADTSFKNLNAGSQLAVRGWINPVDKNMGGYGRLMQIRDVHTQLYLVPGNLICRADYVSATPSYYSSSLQSLATERLKLLDLSEEELGVVAAMAVGDKRYIDKDSRNAYSTSGSSHLLAVSGLHVGIVFLLINVLLYLLPLFKRGHVVKNIIAIIVIWIYAVLTGLSPSVIRAALMFSFAQLALATTSYRNGLNVMLGSAVIMLALNPNYATDPSFLMSYAAVMSIIIFYKPIYSRLRSRYKLLNVLSSIFIIGVVASLGTAPLVAFWFGRISLAGILINPVVIFTAHIVVMFGVLWITMPFGFLNAIFSTILSTAVDIQNAVVRWSNSLSWAIIDVRMPLWVVIAVYSVYIVIAVRLYNLEQRKSSKLFDF